MICAWLESSGCGQMAACDLGWADQDCRDPPAGQPDHRKVSATHWPSSETGAETRPDMSPAPTLVECQESVHGVCRLQGRGEGEHHREYNSYYITTQLQFELKQFQFNYRDLPMDNEMESSIPGAKCICDPVCSSW